LFVKRFAAGMIVSFVMIEGCEEKETLKKELEKS
jgi:hypothetical protein